MLQPSHSASSVIAVPAPQSFILIAEGKKKTSTFLSFYLEREGFQTLSAFDGDQVLELARQHHPIFTIVDLSLPGRNGLEICRELKRCSDAPILILTTRGQTHERVVGLTLGADDYVVKPFSPSDVVAKVKAILRRVRPDSLKDRELISYQGLVLDLEKRKVTLHGHLVSLTVSEYRLLKALMAAPGRIFLREELVNQLYPTGEAVTDRVIDVHIGNLRHKIEEDPSKPRYILTERGLGYQFNDSNGQPQAERQSENKYRRIFDNAITGIYETTLDGRYLTANPMLAKMFGYESPEKLTINTIDLNQGFYVKPERRSEFVGMVREHESVTGFESQVYQRDGRVIWILEYAVGIREGTGHLAGFQGVTIDITERKLSFCQRPS